MRAVAVQGRWVWGLTGLVTAVVLAVPGARLITAAGGPWSVHVQPAPDTVVRTVTVPQPVTSLNLQSYGGPARVEAGHVSRVQVTETINYSKQDGGPPPVAQSVSGGRLTLADPVCNSSDCTVGFAVTVPLGVNVTLATGGGSAAVSGAAGAQVDSGGGPVTAAGIDGPLTAIAESGSVTISGAAGAQVDSGGGPVTAVGIDGPLTATTGGGSVTISGAAGAQVDSGGGPVTAAGIDGPLTAITDGGSLQLDGLAGPLRADTGGGPLAGQDIAAATATASTGGGSVRIVFSTAPDTVLVSTDGGPAMLTVPGGPYALTAASDGGPQWVGIATHPAARRSITVASGGGALRIGPPSGRLPVRPANSSGHGTAARDASAEQLWGPLRYPEPSPSRRNPRPSGRWRMSSNQRS